MITSTYYILHSNFPWEDTNKHSHVLFIFYPTASRSFYLYVCEYGVFHRTLQVTTPPKKNHSASSSSDQLPITPQPKEGTCEPLTHPSCLVLCRHLSIYECGSRSYPDESISNTLLHLPVMTFFCSLFHNVPLALVRI